MSILLRSFLSLYALFVYVAIVGAVGVFTYDYAKAVATVDPIAAVCVFGFGLATAAHFAVVGLREAFGAESR
ncbi:hypothetical protein [uncultured Sulfitobacter sp.]|uniref:hypothetical protein n=1 Tax=uncultured Sulfitobacter sp. TaxID=191468 RepID=UPI002597F4B7|nr:hypothetical protein [uncultured Sulfitobacter sp.]